jgi:hypothetical protein
MGLSHTSFSSISSSSPYMYASSPSLHIHKHVDTHYAGFGYTQYHLRSVSPILCKVRSNFSNVLIRRRFYTGRVLELWHNSFVLRAIASSLNILFSVIIFRRWLIFRGEFEGPLQQKHFSIVHRTNCQASGPAPAAAAGL